MKSTYGRQPSAPDYEPACVEPGSPMGRADAVLLAASLHSDVKDCN